MDKNWLDAEGWTYDVEQISLGVYEIVATNGAGYSVRMKGEDPASLIEECRKSALLVVAEHDFKPASRTQ